ncbi:MAG: agmatine/peptidylarginine deiminase [Gemmatimonadaceae bacterium]
MTTMPPAGLRMPAEWEPHASTWIAWPYEKPDWGTRMHAVPWALAEVVRALAGHELVNVLCQDEGTIEGARSCLQALAIPASAYRLHLARTNRIWVRDTAPAAVLDGEGGLAWLRWRQPAPTGGRLVRPDDAALGARIAELSGRPLLEASGEGGAAVVLEGGAVDVDGCGLALVSETFAAGVGRDAGAGALSRAGYEAALARLIGASRTIWLPETCAGDRTRGHVDHVARFVAPGTVALAVEPDPADENHRLSAENLRKLALDAADRVRVVRLPFPAPRELWGDRLPASYANFYVANGVVLVPTFNDPNDAVALAALAGLFPRRRVVGINALDLVWGGGAVHCATVQQPAERHV